MLFALKKILSALLLPPVSSIVLALFGLWLARYHRRTGNTLVVLSLLSVLVLSWPPVSDALVRSLERYPAITPRQLPESKVQAIVVLGGGADTVAPEYGVDVLSRGARERVRYAAYLQQQTGLPILATGGSTGGTRAEALVMKDVVEREFKGRVRWTEVESLDTRNNATRSAVLLKAAGIPKGTENPLTHKVGSVTKAQVREIAETKMADLSARDVEAGMKIIEGTARSMGITVTD